MQDSGSMYAAGILAGKFIILPMQNTVRMHGIGQSGAGIVRIFKKGPYQKVPAFFIIICQCEARNLSLSTFNNLDLDFLFIYLIEKPIYLR